MDTWSWSKGWGQVPTEGNCHTSQGREAQGMNLDRGRGKMVLKMLRGGVGGERPQRKGVQLIPSSQLGDRVTPEETGI